ncbi:MAG TPA: hypothetical protein VNM69_14610 [Bacillus sp. (in: firmicutes)]|uniref:hypothetical protein n=1 Tax=Bacillus litorisediminis TaxID=2922713 RepID=UPI001FAE7B4F|nr:hypothetical protein [Bacillus litorisediminis]HWO77104.1 hypothetical protein [Bacillus sp. (in: firmicutes)]
MKYSKSLLLMMIILPWFTVPFLGKDTFKRYLPAGLFISLVVQIVHSIAKQRRWWWWHEPSGGLAFIGGPYFVGTLWILKWTYGKFIRYMALNLAVHSMFTYVLVDWLRKARIVSLVRLQKIHLLLIFLLDALLLYGFQVLKEQIEMNEECSRIE